MKKIGDGKRVSGLGELHLQMIVLLARPNVSNIVPVWVGVVNGSMEWVIYWSEEIG